MRTRSFLRAKIHMYSHILNAWHHLSAGCIGRGRRISRITTFVPKGSIVWDLAMGIGGRWVVRFLISFIPISPKNERFKVRNYRLFILFLIFNENNVADIEYLCSDFGSSILLNIRGNNSCVFWRIQFARCGPENRHAFSFPFSFLYAATLKLSTYILIM